MTLDRQDCNGRYSIYVRVTVIIFSDRLFQNMYGFTDGFRGASLNCNVFGAPQMNNRRNEMNKWKMKDRSSGLIACESYFIRDIDHWLFHYLMDYLIRGNHLRTRTRSFCCVMWLWLPCASSLLVYLRRHWYGWVNVDGKGIDCTHWTLRFFPTTE